MWRCICIATLLLIAGCHQPEVINHNRQAPIIADSTMQYDINDEAIFRGCMAGIAEVHIRANRAAQFNINYVTALCEEVRKRISCQQLDVCPMQQERAEGI